MLYAFLGSVLVGGIALAFTLWRKSKVETALAESRAEAKALAEDKQRALDELAARATAYADQLARCQDQITTLRDQRDKALLQLEKTGAPGSITNLLRLRLLPAT